MSVTKRIGFLGTGLLVCMLSLPVMAQNNGGGDNGNGNQGQGQNGGGNNGGGGNNNNGGGGNGGGGMRQRNFDPAQMMQRRMSQIKDQLGASDDEFAAIQPKLQTVMQLQQDVTPRMFMFGRPGGQNRGGGGFGGGFGATTQPSEVRTALNDLQETLNDQNASPDAIKSKLETLRQARVKAKQDLVVAQQDLKSILTQRQEAMLVLMGMLD